MNVPTYTTPLFVPHLIVHCTASHLDRVIMAAQAKRVHHSVKAVGREALQRVA
jgi:hypothetical protein